MYVPVYLTGKGFYVWCSRNSRSKLTVDTVDPQGATELMDKYCNLPASDRPRNKAVRAARDARAQDEKPGSFLIRRWLARILWWLWGGR